MKEWTINALVAATREFCGGDEIGIDRKPMADYMELLEQTLAEDFGLTWEEIEALEIAALQ